MEVDIATPRSQKRTVPDPIRDGDYSWVTRHPHDFQVCCSVSVRLTAVRKPGEDRAGWPLPDIAERLRMRRKLRRGNGAGARLAAGTRPLPPDGSLTVPALNGEGEVG